jgi:hypothetical protein
MREWTIKGKKHQLDSVEKDLKREAHIKPERPGDGSKLKVTTKDAAEDNKVIETVYKHGAKIQK